MLDNTVKRQFLEIIEPDRYLDQPEALACYAYDAFVEESMPDAVIFPVSTKRYPKSWYWRPGFISP